MHRSTNTRRHLTQVIAVAAVVAGFAVPAAAAGSSQVTDVFSRAVARQPALTDVVQRYLANHASNAGVAAATQPAGEPKNQLPFTRHASQRSSAVTVAARDALNAQTSDVFTRAAARHQVLVTAQQIVPDVFERFAANHPYGARLAATQINTARLAGGEPKNQPPFNRPTNVRSRAQAALSQGSLLQGEPKNQAPFTRTLALTAAGLLARTARQHQSLAH